MEIEVEEYVRTKKKGIFKVLSIRKTPYGYYCGTVDNNNIKTFTIGKGGSAEIKNDIVKHSKNIADLLEMGDYVNGEKVFIIQKDPFIKGQIDIFFNRHEVDYWGDRSLSRITDKDIKSIVTKEQYKEMEYRV